jgi:hypothetical protein
MVTVRSDGDHAENAGIGARTEDFGRIGGHRRDLLAIGPDTATRPAARWLGPRRVVVRST